MTSQRLKSKCAQTHRITLKGRGCQCPQRENFLSQVILIQTFSDCLDLMLINTLKYVGDPYLLYLNLEKLGYVL